MKKKSIARILLLCLCVFGCSITCWYGSKVLAENVLPQNPTLESEYKVGDTILLGKIGIDVAGKQYTATPVVYMRRTAIFPRRVSIRFLIPESILWTTLLP